MAVNEKHEEWFRMVMEGADGISAYRELYPDAALSTARVQASKLRRKFAERRFELVQESLKEGSVHAVKTLTDLVKGTASEGVKLKAATALLNFAGHKPVEKKAITVTEKSEEEIQGRLKQLLGDNYEKVVH